MKTRERAQFLFLTIGEHGITRGFDALTTLALIRALNLASFGVYAAYQSLVALLMLLLPALENIFYREYGAIKAAGKLGRELAVFRVFNLLKFALAIVLLFGAAWYPLVDAPYAERLAAALLAFTLPLSQAFYGIYRETLRFELRQRSILVVTTLQKSALVGAIIIANRLDGGQLTLIACSAAAICLVFGVVWAFTTRRVLGAVARETATFSEALPRIKTSLHDAVLWIHLNGALTAAIQTLDVYFLSRAKTNIREIAVYGIALKAANFFQIIPMPFAQVFVVYLGRRAHLKDEAAAVRRMIWLATAAFAVLGALMCLLGFTYDRSILAFLAKGQFTPDELTRGALYLRWQLAGVALLLLALGFGAYINSRGRLRAMTLTVFAPWFIFSAVGYFFAARNGGPLAAAQFNVPVYLFCFVAHLLYYLKSTRNA